MVSEVPGAVKVEPSAPRYAASTLTAPVPPLPRSAMRSMGENRVFSTSIPPEYRYRMSFPSAAPSHCWHGAGKVSDAASQGRSRVAGARRASLYLRWRSPDHRACHRGRKHERLREAKKTPRHSTILPLGVAPRPVDRGTGPGLPSRGPAKTSKCRARGPGSPRRARPDDSRGRWVRSWARRF